MVGWTVAGVVHLREREDPVGRRVVGRRRVTRKSLGITYLSPELLADREFRTRFARDFARLARVRDARVARVHRYLEYHHGAAVIGDHVSGTSLRALLLAQGAVGTEAALVVLQDSLRALAACHEAGLAHGDITPTSVILTSGGRVRLVDFGLWTSDGRRLLARSTPFYLAPEQWSAPATAAGDVYAAAVTFFECVAGAPPFYADREAELRAKHEQSTLPLDVLPEPVRELVARGLAKDPRDRPEARSLLAHVGRVAARAIGSDWERRGRRELSALLAGRPALPEVSAPVRRRDGAGWRHRRPVRLAAVMGGALALAAGMASPPLAVILPGGSIFGSGGRSPVLAFPEPDRDAVPMRAVTKGQLADRALTPAARTGAAGLVTRAHPPAPSITMPRVQTAPYEHTTSDAPAQGSTHSGGAAQAQSPPGRPTSARPTSAQPTSAQPTSTQPTVAPPACTQELMSAYEPCTAVSPEQPAPGSAGSASGPSRVSVPVELPAPVEVPVQLPVRVGLPVRVELPVPVEVPVQELESISVRRTQPRQGTHIAKDTRSQTVDHDSGGTGLSLGHSGDAGP